MVADFPALAGMSRARRLFSRLVAYTADAAPKGVLILDFSSVSDASASFLRESVLAFRDYVRAYQPELYPVLANLSAAVRDEFHALMRDRREAVLICVLHDGTVSAPEVLGAMEPGAAQAFDIVQRHTQVTLSDLRNEAPKILGPVWNNRLASLIRQGFVVPSADSRGRTYRFVLADMGGTSGIRVHLNREVPADSVATKAFNAPRGTVRSGREHLSIWRTSGGPVGSGPISVEAIRRGDDLWCLLHFASATTGKAARRKSGSERPTKARVSSPKPLWGDEQA